MNINDLESVRSFGKGVLVAPKPPTIPQPTVPKTLPSTPVVTRHTTEEEERQTT